MQRKWGRDKLTHTHTTDIHTHTPHTYTNSHRQRDRKTVRDSVTISNNTFTGNKYIKSFDFNFDHLMTSHIQFLSDVNDVLLFWLMITLNLLVNSFAQSPYSESFLQKIWSIVKYLVIFSLLYFALIIVIINFLFVIYFEVIITRVFLLAIVFPSLTWQLETDFWRQTVKWTLDAFKL